MRSNAHPVRAFAQPGGLSTIRQTHRHSGTNTNVAIFWCVITGKAHAGESLTDGTEASVRDIVKSMMYYI